MIYYFNHEDLINLKSALKGISVEALNAAFRKAIIDDPCYVDGDIREIFPSAIHESIKNFIDNLMDAQEVDLPNYLEKSNDCIGLLALQNENAGALLKAANFYSQIKGTDKEADFQRCVRKIFNQHSSTGMNELRFKRDQCYKTAEEAYSNRNFITASDSYMDAYILSEALKLEDPKND